MRYSELSIASLSQRCLMSRIRFTLNYYYLRQSEAGLSSHRPMSVFRGQLDAKFQGLNHRDVCDGVNVVRKLVVQRRGCVLQHEV